MATTGVELHYLFTARFADGTVFEQTAEDVGTTREGASSYTDLRALLESGKELESFFLVGGGRVWAVDFRDGHFERDAEPFWVGDRDLPPGSKPELVYFRRVQQNKTIGGDGSTLAQWTTTRFFFGWEVSLPDGSKIRAVVAVT